MPSVETQTEPTKLENLLKRQIDAQIQELAVLRVRVTDALTEIKELRFDRAWMADQLHRYAKGQPPI